MISFAILSATLVTSFPGGSDQDLVAWIRLKTGKDCAIVFDPERKWRGFEVVSAGEPTLDDISKGSSIRFRRDPENDRAVGIDIEWWPLYAFAHNLTGREGKSAVVRLQPSESDIAPFDTAPGSVIVCRELARFYRSRFAYDWFYEKSRLALSCADSSRDRVLPAIALALGANTKRRGQMWTFEPDYDILRQRVIGLEKYRRTAKPDGGRWYHQLGFTAEAYRQLSKSRLAELYRLPMNRVEFLADPSSQLAKLGSARLEATYPVNSKNPSARALGETLRNNIDWEKGLGVYLRPASLATSYLMYKADFVAKGGAARIVL